MAITPLQARAFRLCASQIRKAHCNNFDADALLLHAIAHKQYATRSALDRALQIYRAWEVREGE